MHCWETAALLKLFSCVSLCVLTECADTVYTSSRYIQLPLTALRQQPWQQPATDKSQISDSGSLCRRRDASKLNYFLVAALPSDWLLNGVEIKMNQPHRENVSAMAAVANQMTEELARKLAQCCSCSSEVLPTNEESQPWLRMYLWTSQDRRTVRASIKQLEPMSHVVLQFSLDPGIEDISFGFFVTEPVQASQTFTGVMSVVSGIFTLTMLILMIVYLLKFTDRKCCSPSVSKGPEARCANSYCDPSRERDFPPDTGIYMS